MYAATNGFIDTLRWGSFLIAARITTLYQGQLTSVVLPVSTGSFTIDRNSAQRRTGELTVEILPTVPPETVVFAGKTATLLPLNPSSPLAPFGTEVFVELTVIDKAGLLGSSTTGGNGWVPMGTFAIASSTVDDTGIDLALTLDLYDRSWIFSRWSLLKNYSVPAADGTLQGEVVALLTYIWNNNGPGRGSVPVPTWLSSPNMVPSTWSCPSGVYQQGQDPWQACLDMAAAAGYELFFDVNGILTAKPAPGSPAGGTLSALPVVWGFDDNEVSDQGTFAHPVGGTPFTTTVACSLQMTRDHIYNDWFVSATGPNNATGGASPTQQEAADTNPNSPTYVNGEIGDIPNFVFDSLITSAGQALTEAQYNLAISLATAWTLSVTSALNPLFDIDDVCSVTNPRMGLSAQPFIVDTIQTGIRYDAHTVLTGRVITPGS